MLDILRETLHYTYSFYPSDESKKDISLNVWQRPTFNWKLECENTPGTALTDALQQISQSVESMEGPWTEFQYLMSARYGAIFYMSVIPPILCCGMPFILAPLTLGLLI